LIHHVLLQVSDLKRAGEFYDYLLAPLGWRRHHDQQGAIGWGIAKPVFYLREGEVAANFGLVSFTAPGIAAVKAAWEGGSLHGGESIAGPGQHDGQGPYMASLTDPDGHRVDLVVA